MSKKKSSRPSRPTIWLIAEDQTGYFVFDAIIRKMKIDATLELVGKARNIAELANQVEELIETVLRMKATNDCIVVLHDTDDSVQPNRESYEVIARVCEKPKYKGHVTRLQAVEEIEAWLLADAALCKWLNTTPKASDGKPQPSKEFEKLVNQKTGKHWNNATKPKILQNMNASGTALSQSMRLAMDAFQKLPCTQAV